MRHAAELSEARTEPRIVAPMDEEPDEGSRFGMLPWALFVIALGAAVFFFMMWRGADTAAAREGEVRATATQFLEALTTFDAETIDQDAEEIRSFATASFADEVDKFFGEDAQEAIRKAKATSDGEVRSLYIQSLQGEQAVLFALVNQTITNKTETDPRTDVLRIEVQMIETTSGWKVGKVDIIRSTDEPTV